MLFADGSIDFLISKKKQSILQKQDNTDDAWYYEIIA